MRLRAQRWFAPLALAVMVHGVALTSVGSAFAQGKGHAQGQQDLIQRGRTLFDDQQYEESIQALSAALVRPSNTKSQKLEIYRLLALNYITLSRKDESESAVRGLLALQPDYALPASESPRFRDFFAAVKQKWEAEGRPGFVVDAAAVVPVEMTHNSPAQAVAHKQLDLSATLSDPQHQVTAVKIFYRHGSTGPFDEADATIDGDHVQASIPPAAVVPSVVEYYLQGFDKGALPIVSRGDSEAPLRVAVPDGAKAWVLPVAIGSGVVVAAVAIIGGVLLFGKSSSPGPGMKTNPTASTSTVTINIGE
jgi:hypothetical protein